jgi:hypothetical protein
LSAAALTVKGLSSTTSSLAVGAVGGGAGAVWPKTAVAANRAGRKRDRMSEV